MPEKQRRYSPIHHLLESKSPDWSLAGEFRIPVRFQAEENERMAMQIAGLCDLSELTKLGVKGIDAAGWLSNRNIDVPATIYESRRLADGGIIVRLAADEFLLESGITNKTVPELEALLYTNSGQLCRIERQEATFLLVGARAIDVLAQTCGINFRDQVSGRLVLSRVAGVSCGIFLDSVGELTAFRFWIDASYAAYMWETLLQICEDLGGSLIGAGCLFPELQ
jgi:sarcosine oxidase subunit gamma